LKYIFMIPLCLIPNMNRADNNAKMPCNDCLLCPHPWCLCAIGKNTYAELHSMTERKTYCIRMLGATWSIEDFEYRISGAPLAPLAPLASVPGGDAQAAQDAQDAQDAQAAQDAQDAQAAQEAQEASDAQDAQAAQAAQDAQAAQEDEVIPGIPMLVRDPPQSSRPDLDGDLMGIESNPMTGNNGGWTMTMKNSIKSLADGGCAYCYSLNHSMYDDKGAPICGKLRARYNV
jgi:hypothetical protein